jgi:hypothetical protein
MMPFFLLMLLVLREPEKSETKAAAPNPSRPLLSGARASA